MWTDKGRQFDGIGNLFQGKNIIIYGAGTFGESLYDKLQFLDCVDAFVDRNEILQASGCRGKSVFSVLDFTKMDKAKYIVIIAASETNSTYILTQLLHFGWSLGENCFLMNSFIDYYLSIYAVYAKNIVYFPSISFLVTTKCNLNCKACLNFTEFNKNPRHYDVDQLKKNTNSFFKAIDRVGKFHISGGEPFLFPEYIEIIRYVYYNYGGRIENIYTATNGTVLPSPELCKTFKECNVFVEVDDYRETLPEGRRKNDEIIAMFREYDICFSDRKSTYWIDLSPMSWDNSSLNNSELADYYTACNNPFASVHNGALYSCNYDDYAKEAGIVEHDDKDIFLLDTNESICKKELVEFRHGYTDRGYLQFCRRCAGHEMTNRRHVKVAVQNKGGTRL